MGVWRNSNFLRLWSAQSVSEVGSALTNLALPLSAVIVLHATPFQVGLLGAAEFLPYLVLALAAGVLVDRTRPAPLLIGSDLGRALLLASVPLAYFAGRLTIYQLYLVAVGAGSLTVIFGVAQQSALHGIVGREQLVDANAKTEISRSLADVGGPGLGGLLITILSAPNVLLVDAASFVASAALLSRIRWGSTRSSVDNPKEGFRTQVREGLTFIVQQPILRALALALATLNFFAAMFYAVVLVYYVRALHLAPSTIGLILSVAGAGGVCAAIAVNPLTKRFGIGRIIVAGAPPFGLLLTPLAPAASPVPWLLVGGFVGSFSLIAFNTSQIGLRQAITPGRLQGRMTASMRFLIQALVPMGSVIGGALGSTIGLRPTLWIGAAGGLLSAVPLLLSPLPGISTAPTLDGEAENV